MNNPDLIWHHHFVSTDYLHTPTGHNAMEFNLAAKLMPYFNGDGVHFETHQDFVNAVKDGTYQENWRIPPIDILKIMHQHKDKGAFKSLFNYASFHGSSSSLHGKKHEFWGARINSSKFSTSAKIFHELAQYIPVHSRPRLKYNVVKFQK